MPSASSKPPVRRLLNALAKAYPDAHCALRFDNPLQLLIATILSAQCTDKRVNLVTPQLFKKYPSAAAFARAASADLENAIKSTGFFRNKTKSIKTACLFGAINQLGKTLVARRTQVSG